MAGIKDSAEDGETKEDWFAEMGIDYDTLDDERKKSVDKAWNGEEDEES